MLAIGPGSSKSPDNKPSAAGRWRRPTHRLRRLSPLCRLRRLRRARRARRARRPHHPLFARLYPRACAYEDAHGAVEHRRELLATVGGVVVEVGAGHGANFRYYPAAVQHVIAVEPEPRLRRLAEDAAGRAPVPVEVRAGYAEDLPLPDGSVDAVVASLVLCSVRDLPRALSEAARVLRPGGRLYFYEHVRSGRPGFARRQRVLDLIWPLQGAGCHLARDTERAIAEAGFVIDRARHFDFLIDGRTRPSSPCVIGAAVRG